MNTALHSEMARDMFHHGDIEYVSLGLTSQLQLGRVSVFVDILGNNAP